MAANLHALPPTSRGERIAQRFAQRRRQKTARQLTLAARQAHGAQVPRAAEMRYAAALRGLVKHMWAVMMAELRPAIREAAGQRADLEVAEPRLFSSARLRLFEVVQKQAPALADASAKDVSAKNATEMKRLLGLNPRVDPGTSIMLDKYRQDNVRLITSIAQDQLARVKKVLDQNQGLRVEELEALLDDQFQIVGNRAELIARDQTLKLNGQLTKIRMQNAGVEEYIWTTSGDERVRETHAAQEGKRFRWDVPPQDTGHPGDDFQCRCTAYPVIQGLNDSEGLES